MFSSLEDLIFKFFNMYLRSPVLDVILPLFESSLPVFLVALISLAVFVVYCKKTYGEMFYRFFLFFAMLGVSVIFAHEGSKLFSFERPRPYQEIAGTMYYNSNEDVWLQAQYPAREGYNSVAQVAEQNSEENKAISEQAEVGESNVSVQENLTGNLNAEEQTLDQQNIPTEEKPLEAALQEGIVSDELSSQNMAGQEQVSHNPLQVDLSKIKVIDGSAKLYPSSVLSISMAIAFVIALLMAKTSPYIYLFPVIIGWSQMYTGSAYLSDILVGWIVGILAVVVAWLCFAFFFKLTVRNS